MKTKKFKSFYQKQVYSKSELYLSLLALCLALVILLISLLYPAKARLMSATSVIRPVGIGSNLPVALPCPTPVKENK